MDEDQQVKQNRGTNRNDQGEELKQEHCVPCEGGVEPLDLETAKKLNQQVPEWEIVEGEVNKIRREFGFKNFKEAIEFANKIGVISEEQGHHPRLIIEWGKVEVWWWTHAIKGLFRNDFIMAAKTDEIWNNLTSG